MKASRIDGTMKRFGRTPWRFQTTFMTPLKNLDRFVSTILTARDIIERGSVTIDQVVFEPKQLLELLARCSLPGLYGRDWAFSAVGKPQLHTLLCAVFSDWVDFLFVPTPKPFVIYADHDEFTTFHANSKSNLNGVVAAPSDLGFEEVRGWIRTL
jgi:hypothetical protein